MSNLILAGLLAAALVGNGGGGPQEDKKPDKVIEIRATEGKIVFVEQGKDKPGATTAVVGQVVRWENRDAQPHRLSSDAEVDGKPLFDTGVIKPGEHKDILLDIGLYKKAEGKTANAITLRYHAKDAPAGKGEVELVSPAKRGR
jgi:plastocyanin